MRKLYNEFFYIPKQGKIREKVMLTRVAMTITIMVVCLAAMSITAYAYFSHNVASCSNAIKAASFEANVSITIKDSNNDPITLTKDGEVQTANLAAGEYTVLIRKNNETSTVTTGFCIITINDTDYFTQQIGNDVARGLTDGSASADFTLKVSSTTEIKILSHWGTSSCYGYKETSDNPIYIKNGEVIDLAAPTEGNGEMPSTEGQGTTENTSNTKPATTPSTEPTETSEPAESTTEPTTLTSPEPTVTQPAVTEPAVTEPAVTEPAATESTDAPENTETQPTTENTETTGAPTTEENE